jgi:pyruvate/2-oxoglutarate/acetoin dehydrogenase E1 component
MIFTRALCLSLERLLARNKNVLLIGEDIVDPYGGAFKVTRGLSTRYPDQIFSTPISESAITGIAVGLAMEGYRPIVEIMFSDFLSLTFDQVLNHATKYPSMYNNQISCPIVIRSPSGGGRAYGPTHSQSLEKYFMGVPNLNIIAPSLYSDLDSLWDAIMSDKTSVLFVEHKLLYPLECEISSIETMRNGLIVTATNTYDNPYPWHSVSLVPPEHCQVTVVAYGYQAYCVEQVLLRLGYEDEIFVHLLIPTLLNKPTTQAVVESIKNTGKLLAVEEGTQGHSWGGEVVLNLYCTGHGLPSKDVKILTSPAEIIPSAKQLESKMLVGEEKIKMAILELIA